MPLETLNAQLFLSSKFQAKVFGQELLGFRQPNLIECLSKGQVNKKFVFLLLCFNIDLQGPVTRG